MKIAVIGATGKAGSLIVKECLARNHEVTAIVRDPKKVIEPGIGVIVKDIFALEEDDLKDFDVVVNAFNAPAGHEEGHVIAARVLTKALAGNLHTRLVIIGGAGSLYVDEAKTLQLVDTPDFPAAVYPTAKNAANALSELMEIDNVEWTYISPAIFFDPQGPRTGKYTLGNDNVITNSQGQSYVSYPDFVVALVDEIENGNHIRERFTVVSQNKVDN